MHGQPTAPENERRTNTRCGNAQSPATTRRDKIDRGWRLRSALPDNPGFECKPRTDSATIYPSRRGSASARWDAHNEGIAREGKGGTSKFGNGSMVPAS